MAGRWQHLGVRCYTSHLRSKRLVLGLQSGGEGECVGLVPAGLGVYVLMCNSIRMSVFMYDPGFNTEHVIIYS